MRRDEFEQLVSAWLDEPERLDLRERIEAAVAAHPAYAALLAEWRAFDEKLRAQAPAPGAIDWRRVEQRVSGAIDRDDSAEHRLDELLAWPTSLEDRVDWVRQRARIMAAATVTAVPARRRRARLIAGALTAFAAAAALLLSFVPTRGPVHVPAPAAGGVARVELHESPAPASGVARFEISGGPATAPPPEPERFFVLDPVVSSAPASDSLAFY